MLPVRSASSEEKTAFADLTYAISEDGTRINGHSDKLDALKQAIKLIFATRRYAYPIYSHSYGNEFSNLYSLKGALFESEAKRLITEALLTDDRIISVDNFSFAYEQSRSLISFTVRTVYGSTSYSDII